MARIALIVAKAENGVIGSSNDLPWYLPADLRRFKELTTGHTIVMGRKTYDSIVARLGHALPNRRNVVLTRDRKAVFPGVEIVFSIEDIRNLDGDVYGIGGAEVYRQLLPYAETLYITEVKASIAGDTFFPELDEADWREVSREAHVRDDANQYDYDFVQYERVHETH